MTTQPTNRTVRRLRRMVTGERPDPFAPTFTDYAGNPLDDIDDWNATGVALKPDDTVHEYNATVDGAAGVFTLPELDQAGTWYVEVWIGNGTLRYCSDLYVFDVGEHLGDEPPDV